MSPLLFKHTLINTLKWLKRYITHSHLNTIESRSLPINSHNNDVGIKSPANRQFHLHDTCLWIIDPVKPRHSFPIVVARYWITWLNMFCVLNHYSFSISLLLLVFRLWNTEWNTTTYSGKVAICINSWKARVSHILRLNVNFKYNLGIVLSVSNESITITLKYVPGSFVLCTLLRVIIDQAERLY